jgi:FkbM family methyltransferase
MIEQDHLHQDSSIVFSDGHLRLRRCRHGRMLFNLNDVYIGTMLDLYGEYCEGELDIFRQILRPGMTTIEVGSNIGAHTVPIAQVIGPGGKVFAFEPQRAVFQVLCANLAINGIENVDAHWAAVGTGNSKIRVPRLDSTAKNNFGGLSLEKEVGEEVRLVLLDEFQFQKCHLLKIDVEGMELEVIQGARTLINTHQPIIYVENDRKDKSPALIHSLFELGYRCYWHTPPYVRIPNFRGNTENKFSSTVAINMLCTPRSQEISVNAFREVKNADDWWSRKA